MACYFPAGCSKRPFTKQPRRTVSWTPQGAKERERSWEPFSSSGRERGATGFDGNTDTTVACRALFDSLTPGKCNCQSRTGTRSLISCDVLPSEARGGGRARCSGLVQGRCSAAEDENFLG